MCRRKEILSEDKIEKKWTKLKKAFFQDLKEKDGDLICVYCTRVCSQENDSLNYPTIDHLVPVSKKGDFFNLKNWAISCKFCNGLKGDKNTFPVVQFSNPNIELTEEDGKIIKKYIQFSNQVMGLKIIEKMSSFNEVYSQLESNNFFDDRYFKILLKKIKMVRVNSLEINKKIKREIKRKNKALDRLKIELDRLSVQKVSQVDISFDKTLRAG